MFTCISCRVSFDAAPEQRAHFLTDWHRYNMKRRVADLPPVAAGAFNEKVLERREQNAVKSDPRDLFCSACSKSFSTENAYRSHIQSRRHRDKEAVLEDRKGREEEFEAKKRADQSGIQDSSGSVGSTTLEEDDIDHHIASSRRKIKAADCLFCPARTPSIPDAISHMSRDHSFFIPDRDHLTDIAGLLAYLAEKVTIGNICLYCPNGGKEFGSLAAVRKHMVDKAHCKLAYETSEDVAELADFYDYFIIGEEEAGWEDVEIGSDADGELEVSAGGSATLASDGLSLLLPTGRTLGHRSLRIYYSQRLRLPRSSTDITSELVPSKVAQVRQRLADPTQALVPLSGGHGAFGQGLEVIKARNAGEAAWARRQGRSFRDQRVKEALRTKVGFKHNSQKYYRDPLREPLVSPMMVTLRCIMLTTFQQCSKP